MRRVAKACTLFSEPLQAQRQVLVGLAPNLPLITGSAPVHCRRQVVNLHFTGSLHSVLASDVDEVLKSRTGLLVVRLESASDRDIA